MLRFSRALAAYCAISAVAAACGGSTQADDDGGIDAGAGGSGGSGGKGGGSGGATAGGAGGAVATGGSGGTSTGGSGGSTGGSGGSTGGSGGSTGGAGGTGGSSGAAGASCEPKGPGGCYTCGQVIDFSVCPAPPTAQCGWAIPGGDSGAPTKSAAKFFELYDCFCAPGNCDDECVSTCTLNEVPKPQCIACWSQDCSAELAACNADDGT